MPTMKLQAKKMSDAKVSFISLVERGANRIPFKIVKQEKGMKASIAGLDLGSLFTRKSEKPAEIVGVVTLKGEGFESIKKQVADAGFAVDAAEEMEDGSVVFKQGDFEGEGTVIRLNEHVALVTKGFSPYNMDVSMDDVSFADMCNAQGFYPGIQTIMEVMREAVNSAVRNAKTPSDARTAVAKMFDEAKAYTQAFLSSLPEKAFKLEGMSPEVAVASKSEGEEKPAGEEAPAGETAPAGEAPAGETKPEGEETVKTEEKKPEGEEKPAGEQAKKDEQAPAKDEPKVLTEEQVSSIVTTQVSALADSLTKKMGEMLEGITKSVKETADSIGAKVAEVSDRVTKAEEKAQKTEEALKGTVVAGAEGGDHNPTRKSETGASRSLGEFDTGFSLKRRA